MKTAVAMILALATAAPALGADATQEGLREYERRATTYNQAMALLNARLACRSIDLAEYNWRTKAIESERVRLLWPLLTSTTEAAAFSHDKREAEALLHKLLPRGPGPDCAKVQGF